MFDPRSRLPLVLSLALLLAPALSGCAGGIFYDHGQNGEWAREFLSDSKYTRLIIEIDYEAGAKPEDSTVNRLKNVAESHLSKPGGIQVRESADVSGSGKGAKYSFVDIRDELESDARDHYKNGDEAVLYVLFLNGGSDADKGSSRVLGAAYSGSSVVMFKDNIRAAQQSCFSIVGLGCPSVATIEEAVMVHELGHILGLVNNGIPMQSPHEMTNDPVQETPRNEGEGHSKNSNSVMYWKVETGNIIDFINNGNRIPNQFDSDDKADMRAAGGK